MSSNNGHCAQPQKASGNVSPRALLLARPIKLIGIERLDGPAGANIAEAFGCRNGRATHEPRPNIARVVGPENIACAGTAVVAGLRNGPVERHVAKHCR